jgi:hypothetical protein
MKTTLLNSEVQKKRTASVSSADKIAAKSLWRVTAEFIVTLVLIADLLVIFAGLSFSYWFRFKSGFVPYSFDLKQLPVYY